MWQTKLGPWLKFMWFIATPGFTLVNSINPLSFLFSTLILFIKIKKNKILIVFTIMTYSDLTYNRVYIFPQWALSIGWVMACSSLLCIPGYAIYRIITTKGSLIEVRI